MFKKNFDCKPCGYKNKNVPFTRNTNRWGVWIVSVCTNCGRKDILHFEEKHLLQPNDSRFTETYGYNPIKIKKDFIEEKQKKEELEDWKDERNPNWNRKQKNLVKEIKRKIKTGEYQENAKRRKAISKSYVGRGDSK